MALNPLLKKLVSQSQGKYSGNSGKTVKPKEGRNVIRVLAPTSAEAEWIGADGKFWRDLGVYWIKAEISGKPIAVVGCEQIVYDRPSVISAAIDMALAGAYDEDSKKLYEEWKVSKSVLINVINRDNGNIEVWELTPTTFGKILDQINLYEESSVDILDSQTGMDIVITKSGKGLNTNYEVSVLPMMPGKPHKSVTAAELKAVEDLDKFVAKNYFRGEEQKALNAIAQIAGIRVPQIGAPVTPTAALTSTAATVGDTPDFVAIAAAREKQEAETAARNAALQLQQQQALAAQSAPVVDPVAAQIAALQAQLAAAQAAAVVAPAVVTVAPVATAETSVGDMSVDDQDALLAELNSIGQ